MRGASTRQSCLHLPRGELPLFSEMLRASVLGNPYPRLYVEGEAELAISPVSGLEVRASSAVGGKNHF